MEEQPIKEQLEKIAKEFIEAGTSKWNAARIVKELETQKLQTKQLREKSFELLKKLDPAAAEVFESFQKMKVYNSKETVKPFDRGNIIHSLLKETSLSRAMAEKIGVEVENKLKDLNIQHISTALIREMVCVKLLEYGQEKIRTEYTRIGIPVFEARQNILNHEIFEKEMLREYHWTTVFPEKIKDLHFKSTISICDTPYFSTRNFSKKFYFEPKETILEKQIIELGEQIALQKKQVSSGIFLDSINHSFAASLEKESKKKTEKAAELIIMQLNSQFGHLQNWQNIVCMDFFDDGEKKSSPAQKEKAQELAQQIIKKAAAQSNAFEIAVKLDSKYKLALIDPALQQGIFYLNCSEHQTNLLPPQIPTTEHEILLFAGINLPKIAASAAQFESVKEKIAQISTELKKLFELKKALQKKEESKGAFAIGLFAPEYAAELIGMDKNYEKFLNQTIQEIKSNSDEKTIITEFSEKHLASNFSKTIKIAQQKNPKGKDQKTPHPDFKTVLSARTKQEVEEMISKKVPAIFFEKQLRQEE